MLLPKNRTCMIYLHTYYNISIGYLNVFLKRVISNLVILHFCYEKVIEIIYNKMYLNYHKIIWNINCLQ